MFYAAVIGVALIAPAALGLFGFSAAGVVPGKFLLQSDQLAR